jgi:RNA polymerase-binding transcription factor DksA
MRTSNQTWNGLEGYRRLLLDEREELLATFQAELDSRVGPGLAAPEDLPPLFNRRFVAFPISQFDYLRFKLIDSALEQVDNGNYGVCLDRGDSISSTRLAETPLANLCLT